MRIGVPKEVKDHEFRVGLTPESVGKLTNLGHSLCVQADCGVESGFSNASYLEAGATLAFSAEEIFATSDLIIKVKEPQPSECRLLRPDQVLCAFLHLAPDPNQAEALLASGCIAIAYETVTDAQGKLPLLTPMSEVAGRLSVQLGAHYLERIAGGAGVLLGGITGVLPAKVVILGGGSAGTQAVQVALGMGAEVVVIDKSSERLKILQQLFESKITTKLADPKNLAFDIKTADLVIGAALVAGAVAPKLITRAMVREMRARSVVVDISIDQGGCFETSHPTTHSNPTYVEEGVIHYCVTNMPAGVPRTASIALNHASLPFITAVANKGYRKACLEDPHLLQGLNLYKGCVTHPAVALALHKDFVRAEAALTEKFS